MPLIINLRHLEDKDLELQGEISAEELELNNLDELVRVHQPLHYDLTVQKTGDQILVRGQFDLIMECECSRCLKTFEQPLEFEDWACALPLEGEEKILVVNDCTDLTPFLREDILLEFPQHPLCRIECAGLPRNADVTANQPSAKQVPSGTAWAELNKLKF
jgi:uncharacterized protein